MGRGLWLPSPDRPMCPLQIFISDLTVSQPSRDKVESLGCPITEGNRSPTSYLQQVNVYPLHQWGDHCCPTEVGRNWPCCMEMRLPILAYTRPILLQSSVPLNIFQVPQNMNPLLWLPQTLFLLPMNIPMTHSYMTWWMSPPHIPFWIPDFEIHPSLKSISLTTFPLLSESDYFGNSESEVPHPLISLAGEQNGRQTDTIKIYLWILDTRSDS